MVAGDHVHRGPTVGEPGNWRTLSPFTFDGGESWRSSIRSEGSTPVGQPLNSAELAGPTWSQHENLSLSLGYSILLTVEVDFQLNCYHDSVRQFIN
jgi:hypothetical protein